MSSKRREVSEDRIKFACAASPTPGILLAAILKHQKSGSLLRTCTARLFKSNASTASKNRRFSAYRLEP
jgi:hypothetical protein